MSALAPDVEGFAFDDENREEMRCILARYPERYKASAVIPLLHLAQRQHGGWLPRAILDYVADELAMPRIRVYEVASFYDMFNTEPTGRCQIRVCTTTPCWLCGSDEVVRACEEALGVKVGGTTDDGRFFLREFECLGACANAPMMWVDDAFYEDLDYASAKRIVEALMRGERPRPGPQNGRHKAMPIGGKTTLLDVPADVAEPGPEAEGDHPRDQEPVEAAKPPGVENEESAALEAEGVPPVDGEADGPAERTDTPLRGDEDRGTVDRRDEG